VGRSIGCVKQTQLSASEFTLSNAIFHDDDKERKRANESECYRYVDYDLRMPALSSARSHAVNGFISAPAYSVIFRSHSAEVKK
jgi:hypothetical protein